MKGDVMFAFVITVGAVVVALVTAALIDWFDL